MDLSWILSKTIFKKVQLSLHFNKCLWSTYSSDGNLQCLPPPSVLNFVLKLGHWNLLCLYKIWLHLLLLFLSSGLPYSMFLRYGCSSCFVLTNYPPSYCKHSWACHFPPVTTSCTQVPFEQFFWWSFNQVFVHFAFFLPEPELPPLWNE